MDFFSHFDSLPDSASTASADFDSADTSLQNRLPSPVAIGGGAAHVSFVGAGPGDPELLTLKAVKKLEQADVIIYDRLVAIGILKLARADALLIDVGKTPGLKGWKQHEINKELVLQAKDGAHVVRLKSGDPSIYGRLDEELTALDAAGIQYDIVPGITSALSAAASARVSLTKRQRNSSLRFITGQDTQGYAEHDWQALSKKDSVAVMYMGRNAASFVQSRLLRHHCDPYTPVTLVENASRLNQRILNTTLSALSETISEEKINGPIVVLLGINSPVNSQTTLKTDKENTYTQTAVA